MKITLSREQHQHLRELGHPKPPKAINISAAEYVRVNDAWIRTLGKDVPQSELHRRVVAHLAWSKHAADQLEREQVDMRGVIFWLRIIAALLLTIAYGVGELAMHRLTAPQPKPTPTFLQGVVFQTNEEVPNGIEEKQEDESKGEKERQILDSVIRLLGQSNTQVVLLTACVLIIFVFFAEFHRL